MAIEIVGTGETTVAEWARAYSSCERATFFHGPKWSEIWEAYTRGRYRPTPRLVEFSDGRAVVLGMTTERVGLGVERHHLSPGGTYGGWVGAEPLPCEHVEVLTREILQLRSLVWRLSPYDQDDASLRPDGHHDVTHVIDLRDGANAARGRWRSSARQQTRRAERAGVRVREGSTRDDWLAYDALYRMSIERWDQPALLYEKSLFMLLHELATPAVRLFLAEENGRPAAGAVLFVAHRHAVYWHGASVGQEVPGASNLLHWRILERLASQGIELYDLNPSGGHAGVARFKDTLGAERLPAPIVIEPHRLEGVARRVDRWKGYLLRREAR